MAMMVRMMVVVVVALIVTSHKYQRNSHQPVHTYTTYIWQRGRQNRKTGNGRKIQHSWGKRGEKKKFNPVWVQCENRKKTPQHKSTYTIDTTLQTWGKHIQLWQAAIRSGAICFGAGRRPAWPSLANKSRRHLVGGGEYVCNRGGSKRSPTAALFPGLLRLICFVFGRTAAYLCSYSLCPFWSLTSCENGVNCTKTSWSIHNF